jgi:hypothetical protein
VASCSAPAARVTGAQKRGKQPGSGPSPPPTASHTAPQTSGWGSRVPNGTPRWADGKRDHLTWAACTPSVIQAFPKHPAFTLRSPCACPVSPCAPRSQPGDEGVLAGGGELGKMEGMERMLGFLASPSQGSVCNNGPPNGELPQGRDPCFSLYPQHPIWCLTPRGSQETHIGETAQTYSPLRNHLTRTLHYSDKTTPLTLPYPADPERLSDLPNVTQ